MNWRKYFDDMYRKLLFREKVVYKFWLFVYRIEAIWQIFLYRVFGIDWTGDDE